MMPYFFLFYFSVLLASKTPLSNIARSNQLIREAENAYLQKNYIIALVKYRYLYNSLRIKDKQIQLNLAHCYYINKDTAQAKKYYSAFAEDRNADVRAVACQQLGVMAYQQQHYSLALGYFKKALQAAPRNDTIRFNYELAKIHEKQNPKAAEKRKKEPAPEEKEDNKQPPLLEKPQQPEQDVAPESKTEQSDQEAKAMQERLQRINLSREKAEMILEAMKNNEIQYIQQKKHGTGQKKEKMYPDW